MTASELVDNSILTLIYTEFNQFIRKYINFNNNNYLSNTTLKFKYILFYRLL